MKTENIKYFLELNQVGLLDDKDPTLWAHSDPVSRKKATDADVSVTPVYVLYIGPAWMLPVVVFPGCSGKGRAGEEAGEGGGAKRTLFMILAVERNARRSGPLPLRVDEARQQAWKPAMRLVVGIWWNTVPTHFTEASSVLERCFGPALFSWREFGGWRPSIRLIQPWGCNFEFCPLAAAFVSAIDVATELKEQCTCCSLVAKRFVW